MFRPLIIDQGYTRRLGDADTFSVVAGLVVGELPGEPSRLLHIAAETALTNDQLYAWRFEHRSTGAPTVGFGVNYEFYLDNSANTLKEAAVQQVTWSDATDGQEDVVFGWVGMRAGARVPLMSLDAGANLLTAYSDAKFTGAGSRTLTVERSSGASLSLITSTVAGGAYIWTTTASPLFLGSSSTVILTLASGNAYLRADNRKLYFGAGDDAEIYYDGADLIVNPRAVGVGAFKVQCAVPITIIHTTAHGGSSRMMWTGTESDAVVRGVMYNYYNYSSNYNNIRGRGLQTVLGADGTAFDWGKSIGTKDFSADWSDYAVWMTLLDGTLTPATALHLNDSKKITLGDANDAAIYYNGTDLVLDPDVVGSGVVNIAGGLTVVGTITGNVAVDSNGFHLDDNRRFSFGTGDDAVIFFDGTKMIINPDVATGTGTMEVRGTIVSTATVAVKLADNRKFVLGTGSDVEIYYNGTDLIIDPDAVGSGVVNVYGAVRANNFQSSDGTTGWTGTCDVAKVGGGTRRLTIKNGLMTGYTDI